MKSLKFLLLIAAFAILGNQLNAQCEPGADLMDNGDFETGDFTSWIPLDIGMPFFPLSVVCGPFSVGFGFDVISPVDGSCMAFNGFDGDGPGQITLHQEVSIPAGSDVQFEWNEYISYDLLTFGATLDRMFEVQVQPSGGGAPLEILYSMSAPAGTIENGTGWINHTASLNAYAGQTVRLCFVENIPEAFTGPAQIAIDGASLICTTIVPTLSEWSIIVLFLMIAIFGSVAVRKTRQIAIA